MISEILAAGSGSLLALHHLIYPLAMAAYGRKGAEASQWQPDDALPSIDILVPSYQEGVALAQKIDNLAECRYPKDRLRVLIGDDGSDDNSLELAAKASARHPDLTVTIIPFPCNRGKAMVLNALAALSSADLLAFSDVSAHLPAGGLKRLARHFCDPRMGVVGAGYCLVQDKEGAESRYWSLQRAVKKGESRFCGLIGAHGAFYMIRRGLFQTFDRDVINDDFILPMTIGFQGWRTLYDDRVTVTEQEACTIASDHARRARIAAGNAQQVVRLAPLMSFAQRRLSLAFLLGKGLRVITPFCLPVLVLGSLTASHPVFYAIGLAQVLFYALAALGLWGPQAFQVRPARFAAYLTKAYWRAGVGLIGYMRQSGKTSWSSAAPASS